MADYRYILTLTLKAPVLSQAVGALGFGYDMAMLRDGDAPALPGSLVRGNLRDALRRFAAVLPPAGGGNDIPDLRKVIDDWFGPAPLEKPEQDSGAGTPAGTRARLQFDYAWRCRPFAGRGLPRYRIKIEEETGTVGRGFLAAIEATHPAGDAMVFEGAITARFESPAEAEAARRWLDKAARFLPALGALKGVGFGEVLTAALTLEPIPEPGPPTYEGPVDRIGFVLVPDRPFCIAEPHPGDSNLYVSQETLPGGVLKGALAARLSKDDIQTLHFDQLVFTHALPARQAAPERGRVLPLSLAWAGDATAKNDPAKTPIQANLTDLALPPEGTKMDFEYVVRRLREEDQTRLRAPKFQIDWKDDEWEAAGKLVATRPGRYGCGRLLEVHTEIDPKTGQSQEARLFSRDCVDPEGMVWCADIDLRGVPEGERPVVAQKLLRELAKPLAGIGKTKAVVAVAVQPRPFLDEPPLEPVDGSYYIVTLQTPALLFTDAEARGMPASGGTEQLRKVYAGYWSKVSGESLSLVRYFAAQERTGGWFLWKRYLENHPKDRTYRPFWLTSAGSVFLLEAVKPDDAKVHLEGWRRLGLPLPAGEDSSGQWSYNPYIRENGYGEIRVNDGVHARYRPQRAAEWRDSAKPSDPAEKNP
jgi:hypothetical protein